MAGREAAFRQVVVARQRALLRTAYLLTQSEVEAQDLVQEALTRTYARLRTVSDSGAVESYVRRCMVSIFVDSGRRQTLFVKRRHRLTSPGSATTVDIDAVDDRDQLRELLKSLPRRQRTCIVLRFYEDLSVGQTARLLGWAPGTVKRETHDALQVLRKTIGTVEDTLS